MLEAHAAEQFVVAEIPCHVILGVPHIVVYGIVVSEELLTERDVVGTVTVEDVDEGEIRRVGATYIVELRVCDKELVAQLVGETTVEVKRERVHVVVHGVHGIGIRHCHLRCTSVSRTRATVHRRCVGGQPVLVLGIVVTQREVVLVGDVPIQAREELVVVLVGWEARPRTRVVSILVPNVVGDLLKVGKRGAREVVVGISDTVLRTTPAIGHGRNLFHLAVDEEEELVLDDRTTEGHAPRRGAVFLACAGNLLAIHGVATHLLVLVVNIGRATEGVGTRLGDGVHATADEVGLANIKWRNNDLHLLYGINGDRAAAARKS